MHYDIAEKVLIEKCRGVLLEYFLGITSEESVVMEDLHQETVSVRRSDEAERPCGYADCYFRRER